MVTATNLVFEVQIQSQRRDVAQRADRTWWWLWALRAVVKIFSDGEILKTTTVGSLQYDDYHAVLSRAPVRSNMDARYSITSPDPQLKASTTSHRRTSERERTNERANIRPLLTPRAIARGACGHSPYCRNTTKAIAGYNP